jgi:hypothetical protein
MLQPSPNLEKGLTTANRMNLKSEWLHLGRHIYAELCASPQSEISQCHCAGKCRRAWQNVSIRIISLSQPVGEFNPAKENTIHLNCFGRILWFIIGILSSLALGQDVISLLGSHPMRSSCKGTKAMRPKEMWQPLRSGNCRLQIQWHSKQWVGTRARSAFHSWARSISRVGISKIGCMNSMANSSNGLHRLLTAAGW